MEKEKRIIAESVSKKFRIGFKKNQGALARFISFFSGKEPKKIIQVLDNVSFSVDREEILGIIGANGSGKSTLLRIVAGIYEGEGKIKVNGKIISLIGLTSGLKYNLIMKDNIYLGCAFFGLGRKETKEKIDPIIEFAGLKGFGNTKLWQFSEGMLQRFAFSIAIHCNPEILLLDEVFSVGDEEFKIKSVKRIKELVSSGASVLFVSHDLYSVENYCNRTIWLDKGKIIKQGKSKEVCNAYLKSFKI